MATSQSVNATFTGSGPPPPTASADQTLIGLTATPRYRFGVTLFNAAGASYYAGVAVGAALIAYEHRLVRPDDLSRLNAAFFTVNGIVSVVVFAGALVDRIL